MKKRLISILLVLCMALGLLPETALAAFTTNTYTGTCGDDLTWSATITTDKNGHNGSGTLTISGNGPMSDYADISDTPWAAHRSNITKIVIENNVTSIGDYAFSYMKCMEITFGADVSRIGNHAFSSCALQEIEIPDQILTIGDWAFGGCQNLSSVILPDTLQTLGASAFFGTKLRNVVIPATVTSVGKGAFDNCTDLTQITLPACEEIGIDYDDPSEFLSNCSSLEQIIVPDNSTSFSSWNGMLFNKDKSILVRCPEGRSSCSIPESVTQISHYAFSNCSKLSQLIIPDSVTGIGSNAFSGCSGLTNIKIPDSIEDPSGMGNWLAQYAFKNCVNLQNVIIPDSWDTIPAEMFYNCEKLSNIVLPSKLSTIGNAAFENCSSLTNVTIPTCVAIEGRAFANCTGLATITFNLSEYQKMYIETYAFSGCSALKDVYVKGSKNQWDAVEIEAYNEPLVNANFHFDSSEANPDPTGPVKILSFSPTKTFDHASTSGDKAFHITFDCEVSNAGGNRPQLDFSVGTLEVHKASDDSVVYQVTESPFTPGVSSDVSLYGSTSPFKAVSITGITSKLDYDTEYYVTMPAGFIKMADGTGSPAIEKGVWGVQTSEEISPPVEHNTIYAHVTIKNGIGNPTSVVYESWNDGWFLNDAQTYNHELARTAMALSGAAYVEDNDGIPRNSSIVNALKEFGFEEGKIESYNYDGYSPTKEDNDHVGYTFAVKEIEYEQGKFFNLVSIIIKGTSGNAEWYSNFNIGNGVSDHLGFAMAKGELMVDLYSYLERNNLFDGTTKFLVTGHSRGAAVANLVAAQLTKASHGYNPSDVYGYTFAAPAVSRNATENGYENIFNIINGEDFVPRVPLKKWNYRRYGVDLLLPSRSYCKQVAKGEPMSEDCYQSIFKKMQGEYEYLTGEDYESYEGVQKVDKLVENVFIRAASVDEFYTKPHLLTFTTSDFQDIGTTAEYFMILEKYLATGNMVYLAPFLATFTGEYSPITGFFASNSALKNRVFSAHSMAGYYSWLTTGTAPEILYCSQLDSSTQVTYKRVEVKCPVDVYVYNENGNVVASVVNEQVVENTLAVSVENGEKTIDLPSDQDYSIEIFATGDGVVEYQVEELSADGTGNSVLRTVEFYKIDIVTGDILEGIIKDELYTPVPNYALTRNATSKIYPDYDSYVPSIVDPIAPVIPDTSYSGGSGETAKSYGITLPTALGGTVTVSPKSSSKGTIVTLTATPDEGYKLSSITVTDSNGNELDLTDKGGSKYTFVMPASAVTVNATFTKEASTPAKNDTVDEPYLFPFTDVMKTDWFSDAVWYVFSNDLMSGTAPYTFNPQGKTNRAMVWTVLGRMADADVDDSESPWYSKAQTWATFNNVSDGTNPTNSISRQELMTMLWRYIGSPAATADLNKFSDSESVADWADDAMQWAVSTGLIVGDNGRLNPTGDAKRCEVATIFMRFCESIAE